MYPLKFFTKFPELPPELQLQVWESTIASQPSMHLFDVCVPPCYPESTLPTLAAASPTLEHHEDDHSTNQDTDTRLAKGEEAIYLDEVTDTLYLSPLATTTAECLSPQAIGASSSQGARFRADPSMYQFRSSLRTTCFNAAAAILRTTTRGVDTNTIYLGAPSTERGCASVTYDNTRDVLYLCFVPPAFRFPDDSGRLTSPLSAIFESIWSQELEGALHRARRVALDVSQLWPDLGARLAGDRGDVGEEQRGDLVEDGGEQDAQDGAGEAAVLEGEDGEDGEIDSISLIMQDIALLASTMQHNLEVLYLVDCCIGRYDSHTSLARPASLKARDLEETRDDGLYRTLRNGITPKEEKTRKPDVIQGVGKVWREVFDLERLGWDEKHPGFVFAEMFAEIVKMQQQECMGGDNHDGDVAKERIGFKGVRVLVTEDE
ncbi:hypothetical protein DHEL01_v208067 [Diaporthe helianthi]|uniref:2EXR domain-containing protein n=1 Tax=Diaporthe helianthi TaxID=158607 RepID=A0A2P5HTE9_DIAHE|nr:hypothetical protein DHEL01_v208067 [Diaporthe helianthi]